VAEVCFINIYDHNLQPYLQSFAFVTSRNN
jgi:hypothetical protein